jgi:hypothetical protein
MRLAGHHLAAKLRDWSQAQIALYLQNNAEEFRRLCASPKDGVTLRVTMARVPGLAALNDISKGRISKDLSTGKWPEGSPVFQVVAKAGYALHRMGN